MKMVFIYNGAEHLGIEQISSMLKSRGHEVYLLFDPAVFSGDMLINSRLLSKAVNIDDKIVARAIELNPDLIGFSAYTGNYRWCLTIAEKIKQQRDIPIVFGGVHPTAVPERVLGNKCVDFVIIGEGEYATLDLLDHLQNKDYGAFRKIPNLCFRFNDGYHISLPRPYIRDLDALPFADKFLFFDKAPILEEQFRIMTARGCPYRCTYCSNDMFQATYCNETQHVRRRSPANVVDELEYFKKRGRMRRIDFVDDVFTISMNWLEEFLEMYRRKINVPFSCSVHPLSVTQDKARLLKEGGCWFATMGIQSGSERIRKEVFKRQGTNEMIKRSISYIKEAGILLSVDNIFGSPTETEEELQESLEFYKDIKPDRIVTFWLTYYPRTSIIDYAIRHNELSAHDVETIENGIVGFTHNTGSVNKEKQNRILAYELQLQLAALIHNRKAYKVLAKIFMLMPCKKMISLAIFVLNIFKNMDRKMFFNLRYIVSKKHKP